MATLDGALAFAQCEHGAGAVSQQLDLDMAWALDVLLAEDAVVAERGFGLPPSGGERLFQLFGGPNDAHAASAAARGRLDDEREADILGLAVRDDGNAGLPGDLLRGELVAALTQRLG